MVTKQLIEAMKRESNDVVVVAINTRDEQRTMIILNAVGTSLVHWFRSRAIGFYLLFRQ